MAVFLFLAQAASVFVPYHATDMFRDGFIEYKALEETVATHENVITLALDITGSDLASPFMSARPLFPEVHFVIVMLGDMKKLLNQTAPIGSFITIIRGGKVDVCFGPVLDENTLMTMIDLHLTKQRSVLQSQVDLLSSLDGAPRTVVALEADFEKVMQHVADSGVSHGPTNVLLIDKRGFGVMGAGEGDCVMFRRDDAWLGPIPGCSLDMFKKLARPEFSRANALTPKSERLILAIRTKVGDIPNITAICEPVAAKYPDVDIVLADESLWKEIANLQGTQSDWNMWPTNVALVNFADGYYHNTSAFVPPSIRGPYMPREMWVSVLTNLLDAAMSGSLPAVYKTQRQSKNKGPVTFAVSTTYQSLIDDPEHDVIVVYVGDQSADSAAVVKKFSQLAGDLADSKDANYSFVLVDVQKNRIPGGFPVTTDQTPLLLMFPRDSKTNPVVLPYSSTDVLLWFTRRYSKTPHAFPFTYPNSAALSFISQSVSNKCELLSPVLGASMRQQLHDLIADSEGIDKQEL